MEKELPYQDSAHLESSSEMNKTEHYFTKPRKSVVQGILNYSKALKVEKSKLLGTVELLTN